MKQQSQIILWLLLAATAAVDAVAIQWLRESGTMSQAVFLYDAMVTAQLSIVCIWCVLGTDRTWAAWIAAIAAVSGVSIVNARILELSLAEAAGIYGSYFVLLGVVLWALKRTRFWRQLVGTEGSATWQYSLSHLLIAMTVLALLIGALRGSSLLLDSADSWKSFVVLTIGDVLLATSTLVVWLWTSWRPQWWPRLAAVLVPAMAIGALEALLAFSGALGEDYANVQAYSPFGMVAYTLIASGTIFIYLELAPLILRTRPATSLPPIE